MNLAVLLMVLGALFLVGLAADEIGRRTRLPRVTLLLVCGVAVGGAGFDLIPAEVSVWYDFLSVVALTMVAFLLGSALTMDSLRKNGRAIVNVSVAIVLATVVIVSAGLWLAGLPLSIALIFGAISTATDPAGTQDAIRQSGRKGRFVQTLTGIVAIDDAWGMAVFSIVLVLAGGIAGELHPAMIFEALYEIGGAVLLGGVIGFPAAVLTGRVSEGEPLQSEAIGLVFLTSGLALWLGVSFLIAGMTVGMIIVNFARHHDSAFHEIENVQWPFMMLFFLLAGASLELDQLAGLGWIGGAYVGLRIAGRFAGGWIGATLANLPVSERKWYGPALLPQAGVAVGMALVAGQKMPQAADIILTLTIGTTVIFEILGPAATLWVVRRVKSNE